MSGPQILEYMAPPAHQRSIFFLDRAINEAEGGGGQMIENSRYPLIGLDSTRSWSTSRGWEFLFQWGDPPTHQGRSPRHKNMVFRTVWAFVRRSVPLSFRMLVCL